jgi:hypothetical protein
MKLPEIRVVTLLPLNESSRSFRSCVVDLLAGLRWIEQEEEESRWAGAA